MSKEKRSSTPPREQSALNGTPQAFEESLKKNGVESVRRTLVALKEFPLAAVGTLSTGIGLLILYAYFQSIGYFPSDMGALFSLGGLSFVMAMAFIGWVFVALVAPMWLYKRELHTTLSQLDRSSARPNIDWKFFALQVGGAGLGLIIAGVKLLDLCIPLGYPPLALGLAMLAFGLFSMWSLTNQAATKFDAKLQRVSVCVLVTISALVCVYVIINIVIVRGSTPIWALLLAVALWLIVLSVSSWFVSRGSAYVWSIVVLGFLPLLLVVIPGVSGSGYYLANRVAELAGVRDREEGHLLVNRSSCRLVANAVAMLDEVSTYPVLQCEDAMEWTPVYAQVLSTVGDRWLIQVYGVSDDAKNLNGDLASIRLTLPADSLQRVQTLPAKRAGVQCKSR